MSVRPAIQRIDLQDQVYEALKARVLSGELPSYSRLALQALADELAVSRSPVHHALTRLVTEGLVDVDSRGYRVRPMTVQRIEEANGVRCALELYAAEQTVGRLSSEELDGLRVRLDGTVASVTDLELVDKHAYMLANKEFHEYIVDLAGNETLSQTYRTLSVHELMERVLVSDGTRAAGDSTPEHKAIVAAYEAGDLDAARAAIRANVETGLGIVVAVLEAAGGAL